MTATTTRREPPRPRPGGARTADPARAAEVAAVVRRARPGPRPAGDDPLARARPPLADGRRRGDAARGRRLGDRRRRRHRPAGDRAGRPGRSVRAGRGGRSLAGDGRAGHGPRSRHRPARVHPRRRARAAVRRRPVRGGHDRLRAAARWPTRSPASASCAGSSGRAAASSASSRRCARPRWWGRLQHWTARRLAPLAVSVAARRDAYRRLSTLVRNVPDADALADTAPGRGPRRRLATAVSGSARSRSTRERSPPG